MTAADRSGAAPQQPRDTRTSGPEFDAVILTGGRGTRLGGRDKAALPVAGRPLLERVLAGCTGARRVVVAGPAPVPDGVLRVQEDPPGGGPVAGMVAAMTQVVSPWALVLAVDQPDAARATPALLAALAADPEADLLCQRDSTGHPQWLLGAYRSAALHAVLAGVGSGHGVPVARVADGLRMVEVTDGAAHVGDVDTWADHAEWEQRLADDP
ncbi:molybdenum cofactor guanylyltransferase [Ruania albidiflava]|uniref:molybdenum cofactor guanylyltransferase n=1 Tax=Ruania albidiflava TaxID=366586 RepID=UPI000A00E602|nr:NTP transferase domain-containing protein [Ruania albidiflava]